MTRIYLELELHAQVTHYLPAQAVSSGRTYGYSFGPADPEELEFEVRLPCGCRLELTDEQAEDVERQLRDSR